MRLMMPDLSGSAFEASPKGFKLHWANYIIPRLACRRISIYQNWATPLSRAWLVPSLRWRSFTCRVPLYGRQAELPPGPSCRGCCGPCAPMSGIESYKISASILHAKGRCNSKELPALKCLEFCKQPITKATNTPCPLAAARFRRWCLSAPRIPESEYRAAGYEPPFEMFRPL
jgi:hypothetical protein